MRRRRLLAGLGALAGTAGLAGCTVHLPKPGEPTVSSEVAHDSFVGAGFQPTVVVTGQVTNDGPVYIERIRLTARLVDGSGESIDSRSTVIERLEREETQSFHFVFPLSATDVATIDRVDVDTAFPGRAS